MHLFNRPTVNARLHISASILALVLVACGEGSSSQAPDTQKASDALAAERKAKARDSVAAELEKKAVKAAEIEAAHRQCVNDFDSQVWEAAEGPCTKAAENGIAQAQFMLAEILWAKSLPADQKNALRLLRESATQGYAEATYSLGVIYEVGTYVRKDRKEAENLYKQSCAASFGEGCNALGVVYLNRKAYSEAKRYLELAIKLGSPSATLNFAYMLENGHGMPADLFEAYKHYEKSAMLGNPIAAYRLFWQNYKGIALEKKNYPLAYQWLLISQKFINTDYSPSMQRNSDIPSRTREKLERLVSRNQKQAAKKLVAQIYRNQTALKAEALYRRPKPIPAETIEP